MTGFFFLHVCDEKCYKDRYWIAHRWSAPSHALFVYMQRGRERYASRATSGMKEEVCPGEEREAVKKEG
jgi:hypothetical protein